MISFQYIDVIALQRRSLDIRFRKYIFNDTDLPSMHRGQPSIAPHISSTLQNRAVPSLEQDLLRPLEIRQVPTLGTVLSINLARSLIPST